MTQCFNPCRSIFPITTLYGISRNGTQPARGPGIRDLLTPVFAAPVLPQSPGPVGPVAGLLDRLSGSCGLFSDSLSRSSAGFAGTGYGATLMLVAFAPVRLAWSLIGKLCRGPAAPSTIRAVSRWPALASVKRTFSDN